MFKAFKYRIYPTDSQKDLLEQSFGCCRWFYNYALNKTNEIYKETGKGLSQFDLNKLLPELKQEREWLKIPPAQALQQVSLDLSRGFLNFFEGRAKFPRFKKKGCKQSMRYPQGCQLLDDYIKLPKLGKVYCKIHRLPEGKLKSVTISKTPSGKYYVSCLFDHEQELPEFSSEGQAIGIDLGLTDFVITSDGSKHGSPNYYREYEAKLAKQQRRAAKKQKGSKRRYKARVKVAKVHEKINRCREDFNHKLSRKLVDENQVIVVENLAVKNMVKNGKLAKSINDAGWGQFCTMLKYKAEWAGKTYIEVERFFPSSKTCNNCLYQRDKLTLDIRSWQCPNCQTLHDRDINAALNIRDEGLRILRCDPARETRARERAPRQGVGRIPLAQGERVRPSKGTAFVRRRSMN